MAASWLDAVLVVAAPTVCMLLGSVSVLCARVPETLQACFQNFSAGLLISAVAGELYPFLSGSRETPGGVPSSKLNSNLCLIGGFAFGLAFMFGLGRLAELMEGGDKDVEEQEIWMRRRSSSISEMGKNLLSTEEEREAMAAFHPEMSRLNAEVAELGDSLNSDSRDVIDEVLHRLMYSVDRAKRRVSVRTPVDPGNVARMRVHLQELREECESLKTQTSVIGVRAALRDFDSTVQHIHQHAERGRFQRWRPAPAPPDTRTGVELSEKVPLPLVAAVTVDAAVDGLLIGLSFAASESAGWAMSMATCIEMGFLGLSFAATLQNTTRSVLKLIGIAAVPPVALLLTGCTGHTLGMILEQSPDVFIGFIAFSIVALLFLVTQELLTEAREVAGDSATINALFFLGLLGGILLEKALD